MINISRGKLEDLYWNEGMTLKEIAKEYGTCYSVIHRKFIALGKELNKPLIIHTRKAESIALDILEDTKAEKVVLHCFGGNKNLIKRASELKYYFTIPPIIIRSSNFQTIAKIVNINQLLTETDAPILGPEKDKRNEPANVLYAVKKIAEIKDFTIEETSNNIYLNYKKFSPPCCLICLYLE